MKLIHILKPILLFCLVFSVQIQAQNQTPSPERVEELLELLGYCKTNLTNTENRIKNMEESPEEYFLEQYNFAKELLEAHKGCRNRMRGVLASIRKDYPGWFNSPNATLSLGRDHDITPRELENKAATLEERHAALLKRFKKLEEPEN